MNLGTLTKPVQDPFERFMNKEETRVEPHFLDTKAKEEKILSVLTKEQQDIVLDNDGVFFVGAGPGSGKTRTLIYNIALLVNRGVRPENILAISFTKRSALELVDRLGTILSKGLAKRLVVGTIHSVYLKILRDDLRYYEPRLAQFNLAVEGPNRVNRLIDDAKKALSNRGVHIIDIKTPDVMRSIGLFKAQGILSIDLLDEEVRSEDFESLRVIYEEYEEIKLQKGLIDFDDMLLLTKLLFDAHPDIACQWSHKYKFIFVDEFQDTNHVQTDVLKHLIQVHGNLKAIGDPRQAIYGFRGGVPEIFEHYDSHFPGAILKSLSRNFRCPSNVNTISNEFIRGKSNPLGLECVSENPETQIEVLPISNDPITEAKNVVGKIKELLELGKKYHEMSILYRTNAQSMSLEDQLISHRLPYRIIGSGSFFDRREIQDMLAYIRLVADSEDFDAFSRMYNKPNRWLGKVFLDNVATAIRGGNDLLTAISVGGVGRMTRGANEVVRHLLQAKEIYSKTNKVSDIVDYVRSIAGYDSWFVANNDTGDDEIILSNLIELSSTTARFDSIENFLSYVEIMRREYKQNENKKDVITLMTIHKAKGLEFPIVFLVGLSEGLLPHNLADELEERRLTYVAITRTMEYLFLSPLIGKTGISGYIKEIVPSFEVEKDDSNIFQYNSDNPDDPLLLEGEHDG